MPRMSQWQQDAKKAARNKKTKKQIRKVGGAARLCVVLFIGMAMFGGGWWLQDSGFIGQHVRSVADWGWQQTAKVGFGLRNVYVDNRHRLDEETLATTINVQAGDPLLALPLDQMRERLIALPEVRDVSIRRDLPQDLHIILEEREPAAIWQAEGELHVVDQDGIVLENEKPEQYPGLILIVGKDAPEHFVALRAMLMQHPSVQLEVRAAIRVGERRWDLLTQRDIRIKLPDNHMEYALEELTRLQQEQKILGSETVSIDLRLPKQIYIVPAKAKS